MMHQHVFALRSEAAYDHAIIPGYQIYHGYLRPHEALEGRAPADACGIEVQGENKWLTLIQNATRKRQVQS